MAGATKTITFAARQDGIAVCGVINLKFVEGDVRAEYVAGTEEENDDTSWSYDFWVQEEDLPGGMTLDDVLTSNVIAPLWSCLATDEAVEEEDECEARSISCFDGLPLIETLEEGDYVAILRFEPECGVYCLYRMTPADFLAQLDLL